MKESTQKETCKKVENKDIRRDTKGRFKPGFTGNPKGNNRFTTIAPLIEALERQGKKRKQGFWDMIAEKAYKSDTILNAVLKKIIPDKKEISGEGLAKGVQLIIIRSKEESNSRIKVNEDRTETLSG